MKKERGQEAMDEKFRKQLEENGADVDTTVKRFMGNEAIYMKFIMKFLYDDNYDKLKANLKAGNFEETFNSAHTLKGVAANLGIDPVSAVAAEISDLLRHKQADEVDVEKLDVLTEKLGEVYFRFKEILKANKS